MACKPRPRQCPGKPDCAFVRPTLEVLPGHRHCSLLDTSHPDIILQLQLPGTTTQARGDPPGRALITGSQSSWGHRTQGTRLRLLG